MKTRKIFGPPGTGKTTRLLNIMESELSNGVPASRLAYLTFTVAARAVAKSRATERFGYQQKELRYFRTIHSLAFEQAEIPAEGLVREPSQIRDFGKAFGIEFSADDETEYRRLFSDTNLTLIGGPKKGDKLMAFDHYRRHNIQTIEEAYRWWGGDVPYFEVRHFCEAYELWKRKEGLIDFTDLLQQPLEPLECDVAIVDEAQDLSKLQWRALGQLIATADRVYVAGDDDQAIYEWAGASPEAFLALPGDVEVLQKSYRLPKAVFAVADHIVQRIRVRQPKTWAPKDEPGVVHYAASTESIEPAWDDDVLILVRNWYLARSVQEQLHQRGLPYSLGGKPNVSLAFGPAIVAWEDLRLGRPIALEGARAISEATNQIHPKGRRKLSSLRPGVQFFHADLRSEYGLRAELHYDWMKVLDRISPVQQSYLRSVIRIGGRKALAATPSIKISTIHGAKGAEADSVYLLTEMSKKVREALDKHPDTERRVFYVGSTRAKTSLTLIGFHNELF